MNTDFLRTNDFLGTEGFLRTNRLALLDVVVLAAVALGNTLLIARSSATLPALMLIGAALVLLVAFHNLKLLKIPLLIPLGLFLVSGWISIGASYDAAASWKKFWLLVGGVALYVAIAALDKQWTRLLVVWGLLLFCSAAGLFFVTQQDFVRDPTKLGILTQLGLALHRVSPQFGFRIPHPNLIAGILLLGLPFGIGAAWDAIAKRNWVLAVPYVLVTLWIAFGLAMTTSRGAVLAFVLVVVVGAVIWFALRMTRRAGLSDNTMIAVLLILGLAIVMLFFVVGGRAAPELINTVLGSTAGVPRSEIFRQAYHLGQDAAFTGIGLDTFALNYASYTMLIDVLFLPHAHNLYLQVWVEQGILGIAAFGFWLGAYYVWVWRRRARMSWLALAALVSVTMMLFHGVVDVLFYFSRVLPLMFIPFGLTVSALNETTEAEPNALPTRTRLALAGAITVGVVLAVVLLFARRTDVQAAWDANQGAVKQSQIELPRYKFPDKVLRIVRNEVDEEPALALFQKALAQDPDNRVANLRMGIVELDRQEFDAAVRHLEAAYKSDPTNRASRKALGYAYIWTNRLQEAAKLLRGIDESEVELKTAAGIWGRLKKPELAANANTVLQMLKTQEP